MSLPPADPAKPARILHPRDAAPDQSHGAQAEVGACAEHLGSASDVAKARMADGSTTLLAAEALRDGLAVEARVQGCADGLPQVTDKLPRGVDEVKAVERALMRSRAAWADSGAALSASRDAERAASARAMHDPKTGLASRTLFDDRLSQASAGAEQPGSPCAFFEPPVESSHASPRQAG